MGFSLYFQRRRYLHIHFFSFCGSLVIAAVSLVFACGINMTAGVRQAPDTDVTEAVQDELRVAPGVSGDAIDVFTREGVVTLTGNVNNILAKDRAGYIAETVKGVRAVVNRVKVRPVIDRSDGEIRQDVILD